MFFEELDHKLISKCSTKYYKKKVDSNDVHYALKQWWEVFNEGKLETYEKWALLKNTEAQVYFDEFTDLIQHLRDTSGVDGIILEDFEFEYYKFNTQWIFDSKIQVISERFDINGQAIWYLADMNVSNEAKKFNNLGEFNNYLLNNKYVKNLSRGVTL